MWKKRLGTLELQTLNSLPMCIGLNCAFSHKMRPLGWTLIQCDRCPLRRGGEDATLEEQRPCGDTENTAIYESRRKVSES